MIPSSARPRVTAVSYLNTVPLVWGLCHGAQQDAFQLRFSLPSACADQLREGTADIGLIPVIEMARQNLDFCPGTGIACDGPVRSILLVTKVSPARIRTLAVDHGSRTSVMLARILLDRKYGVRPQTNAATPKLDRMLADNDAALIIGDPALHLDSDAIPYQTLDLGQEWKSLTGLPMVFAVWSGRPEFTTPANSAIFLASLRFGESCIDQIVAAQVAERQLPAAVIRQYLNHTIRFHLGDNEMEGLRTYLEFAAALEPTLAPLRLVSPVG